MKTNRYILSLLLLMVSVFNLTPANAQQNQYAIYNYRNDGDFNAWLNIDVEKITYSCTDTLGVEHDEVVVQEVWTPDSVYRIPINAIDSIGFRAPKPEFKDGIFHIVEAHVPYTVNVEDLIVTFSSDIPNSMLPSKGQVVISDIYEAPFDEGFAGRVVNIISNGGQIRIECEEVGLDDVYDQLVCVGKSILYEDDNEDSSKAKAPRKIKINEDGTIEIPLGKFSLKISAPDEKDASIDLSAKPTLNIDYTIVYNVKGVENQFKVAARSKVEYAIDFKLKVKKKSSSEEFLAFIPVETGIPGVRCKIRFGAFFEVEGSVTLDGGMTYTTETTSGFDSSVKENHGFFFNDKSGWEDPEVSLEMEGSVFFGPMVQVFVYLVYEKGFPSVKFNLKPGVEFSGKIVASSDAISEYGFSAYDMLKDTKISLGCKLKAEASAGFLGAKYDLPSYSLSPDWLKFEFYLFPKFTKPELQSLIDTSFNPTSLYSEVTRELFFPTKVGMAVFDELGIDVTENFQLFKYNNIPWDETYISHNMNKYSAGKYVVRPVVNNWLGTFNASPVAEFTVPTPVEFDTDNLTLQIGKSQSVAINGGWGDYSLGHLNKTACDAELKKEGDNYYIQLLGKAKGLAPITINDLRSGESTTLIVDVVEEAIDLALSETSLAMETNGTAEVAITSGSGSYTVANSNEEVAVAAISNGNKVVIAALKAGTATITVTDTKTLQTAEITVTVTDPAPTDIPAEAIDLGLPSGTLWASYNVGATKPEEYGSYFAWGETQEKKSYYFTNYSLCDGTVSSCHNIGDDISGTEYDVAHVRWGNEWCMPSKDDFYELTRQCEQKETTVNGVKGYQFTGPNGKSIFLPYAGYFWNTENSKAGTNGSYWSSTLTTSVNHSQEMSFSKGEVLWDCYINRFAGLSVRPVKKGNSTTPDLSLESTSPINLKMSQSSNINIVSGSGSYTAISSAPDVATAEVNNATVVITAHKAGSATITVTDTKTKQTATIAVTVTDGTDVSPGEAIDLGLPSGTLWASCNVGATKPEEYGDYFAWGETKPKENYNWSTYFDTEDDGDTFKKYNLNGGLTELLPEDDAAAANWGGDWRMPSREQQEELQEKCTWEHWIRLNDVWGIKITGPNGNSIFLPYAGYRTASGELYDSRDQAYYWSRSLYGDYSSVAYHMNSGAIYSNWIAYFSRKYGRSVRPVRR